MWVDNLFAKMTHIDNILREWRWIPVYDGSGNIVNLEFNGEKAGDDLVLFNAIVRWVKPGSYIQMWGEDGERWTWCFDGKECKETPEWQK